MEREMDRLVAMAARQGFCVVCVRDVWTFTYALRVVRFTEPRTYRELRKATVHLVAAGLIIPPTEE